MTANAQCHLLWVPRRRVPRPDRGRPARNGLRKTSGRDARDPAARFAPLWLRLGKLDAKETCHERTEVRHRMNRGPSHPKMPTDEWRNEYPFESHWQDVGGFRYHYLDEGQGENVLLFVHGNPTWSFLWRDLIRGFRDRFRCVAPDHIGCGLSDKPHNFTYSLPVHVASLVQLVDRLDLRDITLVAHDWGGPIGLSAMLARRDRFARLVLFNTGAFPPPYIPWRIRACRFPILGRWGVQGLNLFAKAALRMAVADPQCLSASARSGLLAPYDCWSNRFAIYQFVKDIPASPRHPTWKHLQQLEANLPSLGHLPVQLIWGMRDWCFRPDCLDRLHATFPDAEVHRLHDVGHWVTEEAPGRVKRAVDGFLTRGGHHHAGKQGPPDDSKAESP